ncbi:hypothetical protein DFO83_104200 [Idiomarina loihiensis]|uniref:hypothetical protein n=1 Tax=Idiomarina TaxID=135575 RepID=UPI0005557465|nr:MULTISPECIES: hypothetical protein [Idiomarina]NWO03832.1 hypothetical protein [Idiomarinaceae bacterium]PWW38500.1 hypothetical protein DFO83_104200 [Idiomarina loihiensis]TDP48426.1 hypothetical protein DET58_104103 [Idiomarina loihiensis]TDS23592.1 hypothetical protein DET62_104103 [Idiomarina sp. H2]
MAESLTKPLWLWIGSVALFTATAMGVSYFLTSYQASQLNEQLRTQQKQLQQTVPEVPEQTGPVLKEHAETEVSTLLTQAARQHNVDLYYQQSPENAKQWLVGVNGTYQNALRLVASVMQAQQKVRQPFPFTQTLKWRDTGENSGKLSWQFLWLTAGSPAPSELSAPSLFKSDFPDVIAEPIECLGKPEMQSDIHINDWSLVQLIATQTSPVKKALLKMPDQPLLTLAASSWIAAPLMQLQSVNGEYAEFQLWEKQSGCWSAKPLKIHLTKDNSSQ